MTTGLVEHLAEVLDRELQAQGVASADLDDSDIAYADSYLRSLVARLGARRRWEQHAGELLTHKQVLALTGWTKQALSQAVHERRVVKLAAAPDAAVYPLSAFDEALPARPIAGLAELFLGWTQVDPAGWAAVSWFVSPQVELDGATPRDVLRQDGPAAAPALALLARQAAHRLVA